MVCTSYSVVAVIGLSRASGKCVSLLCPIDLKKYIEIFTLIQFELKSHLPNLIPIKETHLEESC